MQPRWTKEGCGLYTTLSLALFRMTGCTRNLQKSLTTQAIWFSGWFLTNYPQICFLLTHPQSFPLQQISPSFNDAFYREWEEGPKAVFRFKLQMAPWMSNKPLQWALFPHSSLVWSFSSPPTPQDACVVFWWDLDMHLFIFLTEW